MDHVLKRYFWTLYEDYPWWKRKVFLGFFFGTFGYVFVGHFKQQCINNGNPAGITDFTKIRFCWTLFGRSRSRWFGSLLETHIPPTLRPSMFQCFANVLGIDLSEARYPLASYKSLAHVFARTLKDGVRPIAEASNSDALVVPCDGEVVNIAEIGFNDERVTQLDPHVVPSLPSKNAKSEIKPIKGATYRIESFLGFDPRFNLGKDSRRSFLDRDKSRRDGRLSSSPLLPTKLVYTVIYLAPHNYHHFHSPCDMGIQMRSHMPGMTLPVFKGLASRLNDLFSVNERVVLSGQWKYGQIHYAAVSAYNVGHIRLKYEPNFRTNLLRTELYATKRVMSSLSYVNPEFDEDFINPALKHIGPDDHQKPVRAQWVTKGERLGEFRMGSTIVLILEVPLTFKWDVSVGDKVRMGQLLGRVSLD